MEEINLACCEGGILEATGRAIIIFQNTFFCVKKVDEQGDNQECKQENKIEKLFAFAAHVNLYAFFNIGEKDKNVNFLFHVAFRKRALPG